LGWVIVFHRLWPWWIPAAGGLALAGLFGALVLVRDRWRLKGLLLVLVIGLLTIAPTISAIVTRERIGITSLDEDSAIQTELAVDRFLHGMPIYGSDWSHTIMAKMPWVTSLAPTNPALHHFVYFPLTFLSAVPFRLMSGALGLTFDYRMVLLAFIGLGLFSVWFLPIPAPGRFAIACALFLNPLVTLYLWFGRNDLCFASLIILTLALLARGRPVWASLTLGFAAALKLFAAPAIPILLTVLWLRFRRTRDRRELIMSLLALAVFPLATILPFLLGAPSAFVRDVVLYPGGGLPDSYPIAGFGFGAILLLLGLVHRHDYFPFGFFQATAIFVAVWLGGRAFLARPTLRHFMILYVALFFGLAFFARYFNDSHVGVLVAMALCCHPLGDHLLARQPAQATVAVAA
jgi:Glycosyltransferase family 87